METGRELGKREELGCVDYLYISYRESIFRKIFVRRRAHRPCLSRLEGRGSYLRVGLLVSNSQRGARESQKHEKKRGKVVVDEERKGI